MALPLSLSPADPGRLGDYEVLARLGTGGQGVVYLGRPMGSDTKVAIKLLHAQLVANAAARARFVRELAMLQRVAGFCTAQVLAADMAGDQPYIVSEFVSGPSLREHVHEDGPRRGADLDRLAISSVTALTAIHRAGIVHRDFKPQNVLVGPDGPRVIDFGIARALDSGATVTSQIVGTPAYMAPEQFTGDIGPATDLWAWATTLLFAATGRDPFAGGALPAVMYRIMHETPDVSALPPQIAEVAAACLVKDPTARPTSEAALLWLLGGRKNPAGPTPVDAPAPHQPAPTRRLDEADRPTSAPTPPPTRPYTEFNPNPPAPGPSTQGPTHQYGHTDQYGHAPAEGYQGDRRPDPAYAEDHPGERYPAPPQPQGEAPGQGPPPYQSHADDRPAPPHGDADQGRSVGGAAGTVPYGGSGVAEHRPAPAPRRGRSKTLPRTPSVVVGLALATLLAGLDVFVTALYVARPSLSRGTRGELLPVVAGSFTLLAIITLVAVIMAWRGSRAAAWIVLLVRVARVATWSLWSLVLTVSALGLVVIAALTALVVILLTRGILTKPNPTRASAMALTGVAPPVHARYGPRTWPPGAATPEPRDGVGTQARQRNWT
jgi:serine/threonine protein kinase